MATPNQIAANKENSQKSTGPKTAEGKATSSLNRLSHGFASHATIIPGENPEEFHSLVTRLMTEHQPATPTEQLFVERMTQNQWLLCRVPDYAAWIKAKCSKARRMWVSPRTRRSRRGIVWRLWDQVFSRKAVWSFAIAMPAQQGLDCRTVSNSRGFQQCSSLVIGIDVR